MKDNRQEHTKIKYYKMIAFSFIILVLVFSVLHLALPDKKYSSAEKRNLEQRPELTRQRLADKTFSADLETYLSDQVPGRDIWVTLDTWMNRLVGNNVSNGVIKARHGYLIGAFAPADPSIGTDTSAALADFLKKRTGSRSYVMLVPTAAEIAKEQLPGNALSKSEKEYYKDNAAIFDAAGIHTIDLFPTLTKAEKKTQVYYKTDHHWTSEGAYAAFGKLAKDMEIDTGDIKWKRTVVCDDFRGTMMSKSGFYSSNADAVSIYQPKGVTEHIIVSYEEEQKKTASIYSEEGLKSDDPYQVFFGGNYPLIKINTDVKTDRKLLILKDSYANSMVQFLLPYFSEIDLLDARYYTGNITQEMDAANYTDVLALYNIETYSEDNTLKALLEN